MSKSKKTQKAASASILTPEEQELLESFLKDLSRVDPLRLAEQVSGPCFAETLAQRLPVLDPKTPDILLALRARFHDKRTAKAIKKAAFRLRQKGIVLPEEQDSEPPVLKADKQGESDLSVSLGPIDGTGSRPVFISVPQPQAGVDLAMGVVNDEEGIIEFAFTRHSGKRMKEIKEIFFSNLPNMVETDLSHAADVLERAYQAKEPGVNDSARAYLRFRPWLREHASRAETPAAYALIARETITSDLLTEPQLQRLLGHELMVSWVMDPKSLMPLIEEIRKAEESKIFISQGQRLEHIHRIKHEGITKIFSEARKSILKYRLEEMAYIFLRSKEEDLARLCLAVASSLAEKDSPIKVNPFLKVLMERSLTFYLKKPANSESPPVSQSQRLILS